MFSSVVKTQLGFRNGATEEEGLEKLLPFVAAIAVTIKVELFVLG
jgi:hypothetical protein